MQTIRYINRVVAEGLIWTINEIQKFQIAN